MMMSRLAEPFGSFPEILMEWSRIKGDDLALVDEIIGKYAKNWAFGRIARVDLAILRIAIFELMRRTDIPPVVSINEAVDIAKEFSTEESKRFVNGILDSYKEELGRDPRKAEGG